LNKAETAYRAYWQKELDTWQQQLAAHSERNANTPRKFNLVMARQRQLMRDKIRNAKNKLLQLQ
jgi:tRNA A22 N-methylase